MVPAGGKDPAAAGRCALQAGAVTAPALRGLSRFADARGIPAGREFLLDYGVIEAFCVAGLAGRASSTRGTYRPALYRLAIAVNGPPGQRPTPFAGARAPAPYSRAGRAELAALAAAIKGILAAGAERETLPAAAGDGGAAAFLHGPASFANIIPMPGTITSDAVHPAGAQQATS